jgi:hypothetical protein
VNLLAVAIPVISLFMMFGGGTPADTPAKTVIANGHRCTVAASYEMPREAHIDFLRCDD